MGGAKRFEEFHFHFGIALGVLAHECRKHAFDHVRRGCHLQHPTVSAPEKLRPLAERSDLAQQAAAVSEQLLSFSGQDEPATDTIEKHEAELMFKIADLPGQSGLGDAQAQ